MKLSLTNGYKIGVFFNNKIAYFVTEENGDPPFLFFFSQVFCLMNYITEYEKSMVRNRSCIYGRFIRKPRYVIWNINTKLEFLEDWIFDFIVTIEKGKEDLKQIDYRCSFEADDETVQSFKKIKQ